MATYYRSIYAYGEGCFYVLGGTGANGHSTQTTAYLKYSTDKGVTWHSNSYSFESLGLTGGHFGEFYNMYTTKYGILFMGVVNNSLVKLFYYKQGVLTEVANWTFDTYSAYFSTLIPSASYPVYQGYIPCGYNYDKTKFCVFTNTTSSNVVWNFSEFNITSGGVSLNQNYALTVIDNYSQQGVLYPEGSSNITYTPSGNMLIGARKPGTYGIGYVRLNESQFYSVSTSSSGSTFLNLAYGPNKVTMATMRKNSAYTYSTSTDGITWSSYTSTYPGREDQYFYPHILRRISYTGGVATYHLIQIENSIEVPKLVVTFPFNANIRVAGPLPLL